MIQIYHNQRCGKSRNCLLLLEESNNEFEIINYLITPPTADELKTLLEKLNFSPIELVRQKEKIWIENYKGKSLTANEIIQAMVENPILIERPIVVKGDQAIIGRDLDNVIPFLQTLT
jgi:arsenate reductase